MHSIIKEFLDEKADEYNQRSFIIDDPISIPHQLNSKEDIEIAAFIVATIAWGQRSTIIANGQRLLDIMGFQPYEFVLNASKDELMELEFVHRTFNPTDLRFFILALRSIYLNTHGLEGAFSRGNTMKERIGNFRQTFLKTEHEKRSEKHLSNPMSNSACKRLNMFLRWMVRRDNRGVDFGLWNQIKPSELYVPLDVHVGNVARNLGLLHRKLNDWKALEELMISLRKLDAKDPCKYDFALFGIGINGDLPIIK